MSKDYQNEYFVEADGTKNFDKYADGMWKQGKSPEAKKHHFQKGHKSPGRPVGSKNKKTLRQELLEKGGMTPAEFLASVVNDENANMGQRIRAAEAAAKFYDASLSSVEIHTDEDEVAPFNIFISPKAVEDAVKDAEKDTDKDDKDDE
mgnify:CR=1 FL=1